VTIAGRKYMKGHGFGRGYATVGVGRLQYYFGTMSLNSTRNYP